MLTTTPRIEQSWCPSCREWTVLDAGQPCAWCDTPLVRRNGGWRRPDIQGRITEAKARAIHAKYAQGVSARQLGKALYQVLGYARPEICETAIGAAFRRFGLPRRSRIEATILASTTSGLSPRDAGERRRRRHEAGLTAKMRPPRPRCEGVRLQYPRRGERCRRPAMEGSRYCFNHDPARRGEVLEITARIRERRAA